MVDPVVVSGKLRDLEDYLARVIRFLPEDAQSLAGDREALDLVAFNVQQAIQSCVDIATHVIAERGWGPADSLRESILQLGEHGVVSPEVAARIGQAVNVRNLIVHGYAHVDPVHFHRDVSTGWQDLERFAAEVSRWLASSGS